MLKGEDILIIEPLKIFNKVVEEKSFSKAAEDLFLSQPGVSLSVRNLESEFGTKLIYRSSKHVELTPAGEIFYEKSCQIINLYMQAKEEINEMQSVVSGSLRIGASYTIGEYILPEVVSQTATKYPNLNVSVTISNTEEITQGLSQNRLDIALVEGRISNSDFIVQQFMKDEMVLIAPPEHPLTMANEVTMKDLDDQIWILREAGSGTREFSDHFLKTLNLNMKHSYLFSSNKGVKAAVVSGLGIALVSRIIIERELASGEIAIVPLHLDEIKPFREFVIARMPDHFFTKAAEVFVEELRAGIRV